jgi:hypothetical protein
MSGIVPASISAGPVCCVLGLREKISHGQEHLTGPPEFGFGRKFLRLPRNGYGLGDVTHLLLLKGGRQIGIAEVRVRVVDDVDFFDHFEKSNGSICSVRPKSVRSSGGRRSLADKV